MAVAQNTTSCAKFLHALKKQPACLHRCTGLRARTWTMNCKEPEWFLCWRQQRIRFIRGAYKSTATQEDTQSKSESFSPKSSDWSRLQFIPEPSRLSILWGGFWAWYPFLRFVNSNKNMFPNSLDWFKNACYYVISKLWLNPTMERLKKHNASNRSKSAQP